MKIIITKDNISSTYEGVTAVAVHDNIIEFDYINRFKTSPEDDIDLSNKERISLDNIKVNIISD